MDPKVAKYLREIDALRKKIEKTTGITASDADWERAQRHAEAVAGGRSGKEQRSRGSAMAKSAAAKKAAAARGSGQASVGRSKPSASKTKKYGKK